MNQIKNNEAIGRIRKYVEFSGSNLHGRRKKVHPGKLPAQWEQQYDATEVMYTVSSYDTVIAWCTPDYQWTVPSVRYSMSTTRHQNLVRTAVEGGAV